MQIRKWPLPVLLLSGICILLVSCFLGLQLGYLPVSAKEVFVVLCYKLTNDYAVQAESYILDAVWDFRLPRILLAACAGMGLSLS